MPDVKVIKNTHFHDSDKFFMGFSNAMLKDSLEHGSPSMRYPALPNPATTLFCKTVLVPLFTWHGHR